ncbi:MAG: hypothetical protein NE330_20980 [Lentisphaeraceae bacterium]|nr:hypothetical protein [Lentisphaeraceae bacterium]
MIKEKIELTDGIRKVIESLKIQINLKDYHATGSKILEDLSTLDKSYTSKVNTLK